MMIITLLENSPISLHTFSHVKNLSGPIYKHSLRSLFMRTDTWENQNTKIPLVSNFSKIIGHILVNGKIF